MDIITAKLGAKMAQSELKANGQVGYTSPPETVFQTALGEVEGISTYEAPGKLGLVVGNTYTVRLADGDYECVCVGGEVDGLEFHWLGNGGLIGYADTGETFVVVEMEVSPEVTEVGWMTTVIDTNVGASCTVIASETIHTIDPKYLPPSQPKVIDLDSYGIGIGILELVQSGGGVGQSANMKQFWDDITTDRELRLELNYATYRIVIEQCTRMNISATGAACQLSFAFLLVTDSGTTTSVNVAMARSGDDVVLAVKVT